MLSNVGTVFLTKHELSKYISSSLREEKKVETMIFYVKGKT